MRMTMPKFGREKVKLTGELTLCHKRDGKVIRTVKMRNLVVNAGKAEVAGLVNGATTGAFSYLAIGTGTTAAAVGNTILEAEITTGGGARAQDASPTRETVTVPNDTAVLDYEWTFTGAFAVTESGVFDAAAAGNLLARQVFAAINVVATDKLEITWKVTVS